MAGIGVGDGVGESVEVGVRVGSGVNVAVGFVVAVAVATVASDDWLGLQLAVKILSNKKQINRLCFAMLTSDS